MFVRSIRRLHHDADADVAQDERDRTVESIEYSDGLGRLLQTRAQAEDTMFGDAAFGGSLLPLASGATEPIVGRTREATEPVNIAVSGATTYDNKGRPVEQFEPFFDRGWDYKPAAPAQHGQKSVLFYDGRGRVVRTLNPDGSQQLAVFGIPADLSDPSTFVPTPWEIYTYDAHDNAGRTHAEASSAFSHHWNTPTSIVVDALGRTISATGRNGPDPATDWLTTRSA